MFPCVGPEQRAFPSLRAMPNAGHRPAATLPSLPHAMTVIRFFEVNQPDGADAPGHYALLDELVYFGPWLTVEQARTEVAAMAEEAGGMEALVERALHHTRHTRRRSSAAATFLHARASRLAD